MLDATFEQSVTPSRELVGDQRRDEIDRHHAFGLRFEQPGFEDGAHAAEAQLPQRSL